MVNKRADRDRSPFGTRMFQARRRSGLTQVAVRDILNISQGTLSELEGSAASTGRVVDFARLYKVDAAWLATGEGIEPPGLRDGQLIDINSDAPLPDPEGVAHVAIPDGATFSQQRTRQFVPWGELGMRDLEEEFTVEAPDDSMAPVIKRGARVDFNRTMEPRTDDVVLLKDADSVWYLRTYQQGPRKRWGAKAENPSFLPMDSERDGLEVIAVLTAVHGRRG